MRFDPGGLDHLSRFKFDPKDIAATQEQVKEPAGENKALGGLPPSASKEMSSVSNASYGGGAIYSNTGTAPQQINNGKFYNNNVYGTVHTMFSGKELG